MVLTCAEQTTYRHSHVGSAGSPTVIVSGGDTNIKGAQVTGKGITVRATNFNIESLQDTADYRSRQQNISAQVTVGYGASASGDYSQSKINAEHRSVSEQSGLFAGDDGFDVQVGGHTRLTGGIITSGQSAEDEGKNRFQTATLTHSDIQNYSRYEGESFGLGANVAVSGKTLGQSAQNKPQDKHLTSVADKNGASSSVGYGSDGDSKNSTTRSGINTRNIHITDEAGQLARTGRTAEETEARIYTGIDTETADQHSGRLKNSFDKDAVAKEINLQREVTQEFGRTMQGLNAEIERSLDGLKEKLAKGEIGRKEYEDGLKTRQRGKVLLNMIGAGLSAPTDSVAGIAAATASPAVSYQIGQYFKGLAQKNPDGRLTAGQETAHILAHGVLGAAVSAAGGNDALAGALASGGAEAAAPVIGKWLYGKDDGVSLSAEEKETVSAITRMLGTTAGAAVGNSAADAVQGGMAADGAVTNNFVHRLDEFGKLYPEQDSPAHDRFNGYQALVSKGIIGIQDVPENTFSGLVEDSSYYRDMETGRRIERPDAEFYKQQFIEQLAKGEIVADDDLKTIAERTPEIASILNAHISLNKFNTPLIIGSNDKQQKDVSPFIASLAHKNPWNTYYRATFDYRQRKVIRRVALGAKDAAINGILEIPFQVADVGSAGINVIFDTDLPVSRSIMGQKAKHGAGSGELIIDAGINAVSVYPPVAVGLASWGVGDSIANNNPEQLGSSLAGLGSAFVLAKTVGNPAYRIDWGGLPTTSSLKRQQMGSINPPRLTKIRANELDVKSYGEAKKGDVKGDNLEHDHIPSFAALVAANETILGRSLTASELRQLKNESTAITLPHELHKQSRTYKGRNTQEQIQEDAQNLCVAQCKDLAVLEKNLEKSGKYTKSEIEQAIKEIKEKNEIRGIKLW